MNKNKFIKPTRDELKKQLSPLSYEVTQNSATEPPFQNTLFDHFAQGIYVDVVSGEPLFCSLDKFDAGCGWPSFSKPLNGTIINELADNSIAGRLRVEVRSQFADSHLGHVFPDGPATTGLRYCINSASIKFIGYSDLENTGYGEYKKLFESEFLKTAVLAGGCFWGVEHLMRAVTGVCVTDVGYTGGHTTNPKYEDIKSGTSGHAEAIKIIYDSRLISYEQLLREFFKMHDPTTLNQQGNDVGSQYRSAIFVADDEERATAKKVIAELEAKKEFAAAILTKIETATTFYLAEDYHQDYLVKTPDGYSCHFWRK